VILTCIPSLAEAPEICLVIRRELEGIIEKDAVMAVGVGCGVRSAHLVPFARGAASGDCGGASPALCVPSEAWLTLRLIATGVPIV